MLSRIYVIDLDDPAMALKYVDIVDDKDMKSHIPLAVLPARKVSDDKLTSLAKWYDGLARSASGTSRQNMQLRALVYYDEFARRGIGGPDAKSAAGQAKLLRMSLNKAGESDSSINAALTRLRGPDEVAVAARKIPDSIDVDSEEPDGDIDQEDPSSVDVVVNDVEVEIEPDEEVVIVPQDDEETDISPEWKPRRRERHREPGASIFDF